MLLLGSATDSSARYWVGGTGYWTATNTANWSYYSGGPGGAPVPTPQNNVYFDANSDIGGPFTVIFDGQGASWLETNSLYIYPDQKLTFTTQQEISALTPDLYIYGSLYTTGNPNLLEFDILHINSMWLFFYGDSGGNKYIDTNNILLPFRGVDFDVSSSGSSTYNLLSNLNFGLTEYTYTYLETFGSHTINTNNYNIIVYSIDSYNSTTWNFGTSSIYTSCDYFDLGSSNTVSASNASFYFTNFENPRQGWVAFNSADTIGSIYIKAEYSDSTSDTYFVCNGSINNLYLQAPSYGGYISVECEGLTIQNLNFLNTAINCRVYLLGSNYPSTLVVTSVTNPSDIDFEGLTITGTASPISGTRLQILSTVTGVTASTITPKTVYWNKPNGGTFFDSDAYAATSGGTVSSLNFPLNGDTLIIDDIGLVANGTIRVPYSSYGNGFNLSIIDASSRTQPFNIDGTVWWQTSFGALYIFVNEFKFPTNSYINFITSTVRQGVGHDNLQVNFVLGIGSRYNNTSNLTIGVGNYTGRIGLMLGGTNNIYNVISNIYVDNWSISPTCSFNSNNFDINSTGRISLPSTTGIVTFGNGTWTIAGTPTSVNSRVIYDLDAQLSLSPDIENWNVVWKPYLYSNSFRLANSLGGPSVSFTPTKSTRYMKSLIIEPVDVWAGGAETPFLEIFSIIPKSLFLDYSTSSRPTKLLFNHLQTDTVYEIDSFIVNGPSNIANGPILLSGSPTKFLYTKRGSISLNNVSVEGIIVYPDKTWYAVEGNVPMQDGNGWIFDSTIPVVSTVDTDNTIKSEQTLISIVGTNLSTADGVQLRQGNNILNTTNYVAGSSPTFTAPSLSSIFSSGIKFGTVQLDIMENI